MGSIHPYDTAGGRRYRALYRRPDGSQGQKRGFSTKKSAELYLASVEVAKARGQYINPTDAKITVNELGVEWLSHRRGDLKPSVYRSVDSAWRIHVQPKWGARSLDSLRPSEIQAWMSSMAGDRSASTVLRAHGVLAGLIDIALRDRRIMENPARGLKLPRKSRKPRAYLTHAQVDALARTSLHPLVIYTLAYTGLRWGEMTGLRVENVDIARRRFLVTENAVMVGGQIVVGTTKTNRERVVPFPEFLVSDLRTQVGSRTQDALVFGDGARHLRHPSSQDGWFAAAARRARLADPTFPALSPHDLRHTAASLAISAGANAKVVQRMLGHASAAMTLDVYADLFEDDLHLVSIALDQARTNAIVANPLPAPD